MFNSCKSLNLYISDINFLNAIRFSSEYFQSSSKCDFPLSYFLGPTLLISRKVADILLVLYLLLY